MEQGKSLVTAAAGKTGVFTVDYLLRAGHSVRAFVRRDDDRAEALRKAGAEVIVGDLLNHDDAIRAAEGMTGAYENSQILRECVRQPVDLATI